MRISTLQVFNSATLRIQEGQQDLAGTQEQLSTGKRINRPSDDPVAAARLLNLNLELSRTEKFDENINVAERRLMLEETVLDQINASGDRIRELTIQAGSGIIGPEDRQTIVSELRQLQDELAALMNTRDAQGEYLFGGAKVNVPPFVQDADGNYIYQGDDAERLIQVGDNLQLPTNDSGREIFEVITEQVTPRLLGPDTTLITPPEFSDVDTETEGDLFTAFSEEFGDLSVVVKKLPGTTANEQYVFSVLDSSGNPVRGDLPDSALTDQLLENIAFDVTAADPSPAGNLMVSVGGLTFDVGGLQEVASSAMEVEVTPPIEPDPRVVSATQIRDADAYRSFVENFGSDLNVSVTLGTDGNVPPGPVYDYQITDAAGNALGAPFVISPAGPLAGPTTVVINDGTDDFLSFNVTPFTDIVNGTNNLLSDDQALSIGIAGNVTADIDPTPATDIQPLISDATITDPTSLNYSSFAANHGDININFTDAGGPGPVQYELVDSNGLSLEGPLDIPADGIISITDPQDPDTEVASFTVDKLVEAEVLAGNGSSLLPFSVTLSAQVDTVLSGQADVTIRAEEGRHNLLQTVENLIDALELPAETAEEKAALEEALSLTLDEIDQAQSGNIQVRTELGARLTALETARETNADSKLFTETAISRIEDLDYAEAISRFTLQETALQAAMSSFSRVQSLTLFDFIR